MAHLSGKGHGQLLTNTDWLNKGPLGQLWQWIVADWFFVCVCLFWCVCLCVLIYSVVGSQRCSGHVSTFSESPCASCMLCAWLPGSDSCIKWGPKGSRQSRNVESQATYSPSLAFLLTNSACVTGVLHSRPTPLVWTSYIRHSPPSHQAVDQWWVPLLHRQSWEVK